MKKTFLASMCAVAVGLMVSGMAAAFDIPKENVGSLFRTVKDKETAKYYEKLLKHEKDWGNLSTPEERQVFLDTFYSPMAQAMLFLNHTQNDDLIPIMYTAQELLDLGSILTGTPPKEETTIEAREDVLKGKEAMLNSPIGGDKFKEEVQKAFTLFGYAFSKEQLGIISGGQPIVKDGSDTPISPLYLIDYVKKVKKEDPEAYKKWLELNEIKDPIADDKVEDKPEEKPDTKPDPNPDEKNDQKMDPHPAKVVIPHATVEVFGLQTLALPSLMDSHYVDRYEASTVRHNHQTLAKVHFGQVKAGHAKAAYTHLVVGQDLSPADEHYFMGAQAQFVKAKPESKLDTTLSSSSQGVALTLYAGMHQVFDAPIFMETKLMVARWNHKLGEARVHQKYVEPSMEVGYKFMQGGLTLVPSLQMGVRMHSNATPMTAMIENTLVEMKLAKKHQPFVNAQIHMGYAFQTSWGAISPVLTVGYHKGFADKLMVNSMSVKPISTQHLSTELGVHWTQGPMTLRATTNFDFGQKGYRNRELGVQVQYRF